MTREQERTRRLENALNYLLGYLDALGAYAATERERESARELEQTILRSLDEPRREQEAMPGHDRANYVDDMSL